MHRSLNCHRHAPVVTGTDSRVFLTPTLLGLEGHLTHEQRTVVLSPIVVNLHWARYHVVANFAVVNQREVRSLAIVLPDELPILVEARESGQPASDVAGS